MDLTAPSTSMSGSRTLQTSVGIPCRTWRRLQVGTKWSVFLATLALTGCGGSGGDSDADASASAVSMEAISDADFQQEYSRLQGRVQQMRADTLDKYHFEEFAAALRASGESAPLLLRSAGQMQAMMDWLKANVSTYTSGKPLIAKTLDEKADPLIQIFGTSGRISIVDRGAMRVLMNWGSLPPATVGSVIVGALQGAPTRPREAILGAQAFARLFDQPAMLAIVTPMLSGSAAAPAAKSQ